MCVLVHVCNIYKPPLICVHYHILVICICIIIILNTLYLEVCKFIQHIDAVFNFSVLHPVRIVFQPDPEDFAEEQWLMGRLVHLFQADSLDQQYMVSQYHMISHMIPLKFHFFRIIRY